MYICRIYLSISDSISFGRALTKEKRLLFEGGSRAESGFYTVNVNTVISVLYKDKLVFEGKPLGTVASTVVYHLTQC